LAIHLFQCEELFQYVEDLYFFKKNTRSEFTGANDQFIRLCGLDDPHKLLGKTDMDFFPKHMATRYIRDDNIVFETQQPLVRILEVNSSPQGVRWFQTTKIPLFSDGQLIGCAGIAKDLKRNMVDLKPFDRLHLALEAIEQNLESDFNMISLAEKTQLSLSQFERLFKRAFDMSPKQYILRLRLDGVATALKDSCVTIAELAQRFRFHDQSHLCKQFKTRYGCSPKQYQLKL
jgi:AraC-like DNA-binding protein